MRCPRKDSWTERHTYPCERLLFQVAGRLDAQDHADVMDALNVTTNEHHKHIYIRQGQERHTGCADASPHLTELLATSARLAQLGEPRVDNRVREDMELRRCSHCVNGDGLKLTGEWPRQSWARSWLQLGG